MRFPLNRYITPGRLLWISISMFAVYFSAANWLRQVNVATSQFDMGNMDQTLWHSLHGQWFSMTDPGSSALVSRAMYHSDFLLLAYLPFYALFPDPRTPLVLQVLIVATGAMPLFWLARKRLGAWPGVVLALAYLGFPPQHWGVTFDVHAVVLVAPLLLWAWWAISERRWWLSAIFVALALLGKEEVGLTVAGMGIYWLCQRRWRRAGAVGLVAGLVTTAAMLFVVIPHFRGAQGHFALRNYAAFGSTDAEVFRGILTHPFSVVRTAFSTNSWLFYRDLLIPVAGVALVGWPVLLIALPEIAINVLSTNPNQQLIFYQYASTIVPILFIAVISGWVTLRRWIHDRWIGGAMMLATVVAMWIWSPLPGGRYSVDATKVWVPSPYRADVAKVRADLRPTDWVAATNTIAAQFSGRDRIWAFPQDLDHADAIVVLEGGQNEFRPPDQITTLVNQLVNDQRFHLVFTDRGFWYFRRQH